MSKLIVPFDGKSKSDVDAGGVFSFIGMERLRRLLAKEEGIGATEVIGGLVIDDSGINIRIDSKPNT